MTKNWEMLGQISKTKYKQTQWSKPQLKQNKQTFVFRLFCFCVFSLICFAVFLYFFWIGQNSSIGYCDNGANLLNQIQICVFICYILFYNDRKTLNSTLMLPYK